MTFAILMYKPQSNIQSPLFITPLISLPYYLIVNCTARKGLLIVDHSPSPCGHFNSPIPNSPFSTRGQNIYMSLYFWALSWSLPSFFFLSSDVPYLPLLLRVWVPNPHYYQSYYSNYKNRPHTINWIAALRFPPFAWGVVTRINSLPKKAGVSTQLKSRSV